MDICFHSTVLITARFEEMKRFYTGLLGQAVRLDFGNCITLACALTLWELREGYALSEALGSQGVRAGNGSLEICFETENFEAEVARVKAEGVSLVHDVAEETWGQRTLRFYDPDDNIVELGESIPCFCRRLHAEGLSAAAIARKTGVSSEAVELYLNQ